MSDFDVPFDDMRWSRPIADPIDAVLGSASSDEDLADVAAIVHDLRAAYLPAEALRHAPELAAFTSGDEVHASPSPSVTGELSPVVASSAVRAVPDERKRIKMLSALTGLVATFTGKALLGTAVAAASVGGLQASNAIDVPGLPDAAEAPAEGPVNDFGQQVSDDARDGGVVGADIAAAAPEFGQSVAASQRGTETPTTEDTTAASTGEKAKVDKSKAAKEKAAKKKAARAAKGEFGARVSADARDGGVDGAEISAEAKMLGDDRASAAASNGVSGPDVAAEANDFGSDVAADAADGGVDGPSVAEQANDFGSGIADDASGGSAAPSDGSASGRP